MHENEKKLGKIHRLKYNIVLATVYPRVIALGGMDGMAFAYSIFYNTSKLA